jgi:SAM-dependent methyltransferase
MSDWGGGYVTDVTYTTGWYSQQSPAIVAIAAIIGGARASVPAGDDPMQVMELGCGFGYAAMALAASNPSWSVVGVDFIPAHIAGAREWAAEAGLTNVRFIEADLSSWEDHPEMANLPEMDFITMHGVWSWVPPATRSGIVRLLARKVLPGGLVHVSYNNLPGWQSRLGAARVIREVGARVSGRSDQQAQEGFRVLKELSDAKAHFTGTSVANLIASLSQTSPSYLAHEFMNRQWSPCFAMDVAEALSEAKLEFVAASSLTDNFPDLTMTEEQRAIFNRYSDVGLRELVKDMCMARSLRHDVFVRGARRLNMAERANALMDVHLALIAPVQELPEALIVPAGRAELNRSFYLPIVNALSTRPGRVGDLLNMPDVVGRRDNPAELISILISAGMVEPMARPGTEASMGAMRFNAVSARRMMAAGSTPNLAVGAASQPAGTPISAPLLTLVIADFMRQGITGVDNLVRVMQVPEEEHATARASVEQCIDYRLPLLRVAGVL